MTSHELIAADTIAAIATPPGRGGIGVIRVSGSSVVSIAEQIIGQPLTPRLAHYGSFYESTDAGKTTLDSGIALFFPGPHSFTGEDVLELQGHGGSIILNCLLSEVLRCGARLANPGEFSERAFLNGKIDLTQAEAIADLIDSASEQAAKSAVRSLRGEFSKKISQLVEEVIQLRCYVESAIDFPEEEIDFLDDSRVIDQLNHIISTIEQVFNAARQGSIIRDGMSVVIAGKPNAGKSSLLNALSGKESAIVTDIEGTTRDILKEHIQIDGMPLHIIDTAGLRDSEDRVEQEGIRRAWQEIETADRILLVVDNSQALDIETLIKQQFAQQQIPAEKITIVRNKCDLSGDPPSDISSDYETITLSAKFGAGLDLLRQHLKNIMGYTGADESTIIARQRHLDNIRTALEYLYQGKQQLEENGAGELLAEDLRLCQQALGEITGEYRPDDLLGRIFSTFCIGK